MKRHFIDCSDEGCSYEGHHCACWCHSVSGKVELEKNIAERAKPEPSTAPTSAGAAKWYEDNLEKFRVPREHVVTEFTEYGYGGYIDVPKMLDAYHAFQRKAEAEKKAERNRDVIEWLRERYENAITISRQKRGLDKVGWLEDAAYFERAIAAILQD